MQSPSDPIRSANRRCAAIACAGIAAAAACAAWAFAPVRCDVPVPPSIDAPPPARMAEEPAQLDRGAFLATIWRAPPPPNPPAPDPAPPAPAPFRLQLLAILHESIDGGPVLRAALYDPDTDRLHIVTAGDRIGSRSVSAVGESHVEITDGRARHRIDLPAQGDAIKGGRS